MHDHLIMHRIQPVLLAVMHENRTGFVFALNWIARIFLPVNEIIRNSDAARPLMPVFIFCGVIVCVILSFVLYDLIERHSEFIIRFGSNLQDRIVLYVCPYLAIVGSCKPYPEISAFIK